MRRLTLSSVSVTQHKHRLEYSKVSFTRSSSKNTSSCGESKEPFKGEKIYMGLATVLHTRCGGTSRLCGSCAELAKPLLSSRRLPCLKIAGNEAICAPVNLRSNPKLNLVPLTTLIVQRFTFPAALTSTHQNLIKTGIYSGNRGHQYEESDTSKSNTLFKANVISSSQPITFNAAALRNGRSSHPKNKSIPREVPPTPSVGEAVVSDTECRIGNGQNSSYLTWG